MIAITSRTKRRWYFIFFAVLFVVLIPVVTLYASGYRFTYENGELRVYATGGIALERVPSGAEVFFDNDQQSSASIFNRSFFVQNLIPKKYTVIVAKQGYWTWIKQLPVTEKKVTHASALMLPVKPRLAPVFENIPIAGADEKALLSSNVSTSSLLQKNPLYSHVVALFATTTGDALETTPIQENNWKLWRDKNAMYIQWTGEEKNAPEYICMNSDCKKTMTFHAIQRPVSRLGFFPGRNDVVVFTTTLGVYVLEIDQRSEQNLQPILQGPSADFRVDKNGTIYVKNAGQYFEANLE